jgi:tetratricopeptide (TPR) repeat protein
VNLQLQSDNDSCNEVIFLTPITNTSERHYNKFMQDAPKHLGALRIFFILAAVLATLQPARAQMDMSANPAMSMGTENQTPPADLPVPLKMTGIGNAHLKITAKPEAQMWFDQGLNLIDDFWDYESSRAFEQSIRVDPKCAMCYWGLYRAESFYHGLAQSYAAPALATAVKLKRHASKRERLYIEAAALNEDADESAKPAPIVAHVLQLWRKLVKEDPRDIQARLFLSERVAPKERLEILEAILKEDPNNSAANHYYIHAVEGGPHPEQALHSAEVLASLAPASGHMVHMPGHIFSRLGDYARAEQSFAASIQVDERYMAAQHVAPDNDWNYVHNLMYAIENLMEEGKLNQASALSAKLTGARGELESTLYIYSSRDSISRLNPHLPVALRTGDWPQVLELLKATPPPPNLPNLDFLARQLTTLATGMLAVESHDLAKAEQASAQSDAEQSRMSKPTPSAHIPNMQLKIMPDAELPPLLRTLSIMQQELRASLLAAQGKATEAHAVFEKAAQAEKALGYHEPPNYIRPVGETEAAAMLALSDWTDARAAYEKALLERPRSGFALYGLALCSEKSGDTAAATKEYADFLAAWKDADPTLPQITHAKMYLATHR